MRQAGAEKSFTIFAKIFENFWDIQPRGQS